MAGTILMCHGPDKKSMCPVQDMGGTLCSVAAPCLWRKNTVSDAKPACDRCGAPIPAGEPECPRCRSIRATNRVILTAVVALVILAIGGWFIAVLFM